MERVTAYQGGKFTIAFARQKNGQSPGADFSDALSKEEQAKLGNLFRLLADHGRIANPEKFGVLDQGLFEFKSFQIRMPCAYAHERGLFLVTHGFYRKRDRTPKEEIERAWRILREDQEQTKLRLVKERG